MGTIALFFAAHGTGLHDIGVLAGVYLAVWGSAQLGTGWISDHLGRKSMIMAGTLLQSVAIAGFVILAGTAWWLAETHVHHYSDVVKILRLEAGSEFGTWSGARDLSLGPHGPELCELSSGNVGNDRFQFGIPGSGAWSVQH